MQLSEALHTHCQSKTHTNTQSIISSLTHNMHIHLHWLYTPTHPLTYKLLLPCLSYILLPSHFTPIHIYLHHSSIPAHVHMVLELTFSIFAVYSMLTYCKYFIVNFIFLILIFHFFPSNTLLLIIALLGFELARKAFHCTCACYITLNTD